MACKVEQGNPVQGAAAPLSRLFPEVTDWLKLPMLQRSFTDGKEYVYVRTTVGVARRWGSGSLLKFGPGGSPAFMREYDARAELAVTTLRAADAKNAERPEASKKKLVPTAAGTLRQAVGTYLRHDDFLLDPQYTAASTRTAKANILNLWCDEDVAGDDDGLKWGEVSVDKITKRDLEKLLYDYRVCWGKAKNFRGAIRPFFKHLYIREVLKEEQIGADGSIIVVPDPTLALKLDARPKNVGIPPWSPAQARQFRDYWKVGTMQRLAFELMFRLGAACADVVRLGPAMLQRRRSDHIVIARYKRKKIIEPDAGWALPPFHKDLQAIIEATQARTNTVGGPWLRDAHRQPFDSDTHFSQWFRDACRQAGLTTPAEGETKLPSAHGVRKLSAMWAAYKGMSLHQMKIVFGWATLEMPDYYTQKANQWKVGFDAAAEFADGWDVEQEENEYEAVSS